MIFKGDTDSITESMIAGPSNDESDVSLLPEIVIIYPNDPDLLNLATCELCLMRFNKTNCVPVSVTCGQTVCKACVDRTLCGNLYKAYLPEDSSYQWTKNFVVYALLDKMNLLSNEDYSDRHYPDSENMLELLQFVKTETNILYRFLKSVCKDYEKTLNFSQLFSKAIQSLADFSREVEKHLKYLEPRKGEKQKKIISKEPVCLEEDDVLMEAIHCSICCERYNKINHAPMSAFCGHTFCRKCFYKFVKLENSGSDEKKYYFDCCVCKIHTVLGSVSANHTALGLLEKMELLADNGDAKNTDALDTKYILNANQMADIKTSTVIKACNRYITFVLTTLKDGNTCAKIYGLKNVRTHLISLHDGFIDYNFTRMVEAARNSNGRIRPPVRRNQYHSAIYGLAFLVLYGLLFTFIAYMLLNIVGSTPKKLMQQVAMDHQYY